MRLSAVKILSIVISFFLFGSIITSCASQKEFNFNDDNDGEINFYGEHLLMQGRYWNIWMYPGQYGGDEQAQGASPVGSATSERSAKHIKKLETDFNLKIEYKIIDANAVLSDVLAGNRTADLLTLYPHYLYEHYRTGLLMPFEELSGIDMNDIKYGPEKLREQVKFGGKYYGAYYYLWESAPNLNGVIFTDDETINAMGGIIHPREYIENGEWNWETFRSVLSALTVSSGAEKRFGLGVVNEIPGAQTNLAIVAILSNSGDIVRYSNGRYVSGLNDTATLQGLEFARSLMADGLCCYSDGSFVDRFADGTYPLYMAEGFAALPSNSKIQVYGTVIFPKGPSAKADSVGAFHSDTSFVGICNGTIFDESELSVIVDRLFDGYEDSPYQEDGWKSFYADNVFFNQDDLDNFIFAVENASFLNLGLFKDKGDDFGILFTGIEKSFGDILDGVSPETAFAPISEAFDFAIDAYYEQ